MASKKIDRTIRYMRVCTRDGWNRTNGRANAFDRGRVVTLRAARIIIALCSLAARIVNMPGLSGAAAALLSPTCLSIEHARLRVIASAEQLANASHAHLDEERAALLAVQSAAFEEARACACSGPALDAAARAFSPLPTGTGSAAAGHFTPATVTPLLTVTGSAAFDSLLCGGLRRGEVVELCGAPASGKTQVRLRALLAAAGRLSLRLPALHLRRRQRSPRGS